MSLFSVQLRHDVELLVRMVKSSHVDKVLALLNGSPDNVVVVVRESLNLGLRSLSTMVPALSDVLTDALTDKCVEVRVFRLCDSSLPSELLKNLSRTAV